MEEQLLVEFLLGIKNDWQISSHEFDLTSIASSSRTDIGVKIYSTNTHGTSNITVSDGVHKFIYDKNSVDYYNSIKDSLIEIPGSFNPIYGDSSATQSRFYNS